MFEVGQYIVYGSHGICKVNEIGAINLSGKNSKRMYYTLEPIRNPGSIIYIPVDNEKVIMRPVMSKEEALELVENIQEIVPAWIESEKKREETYKDLMKQCGCRGWVQIIKAVYLRKVERLEEGKKTTATDERYFNQAEENLYSELAIALEMKKEEVKPFIEERVK